MRKKYDYSHSGIVNGVKTSLYRRWQAIKDRCYNSRNKAYKNKYECEKGRKIAVERALTDVENKVRYDYSAIIGFMTKAIFKPLFRKIDFMQKYNFLQNKDKVICSEAFCKWFYGTSSTVKHLFRGKNDSEATCATVSPKDICKADTMFYVTGNKELV